MATQTPLEVGRLQDTALSFSLVDVVLSASEVKTNNKATSLTCDIAEDRRAALALVDHFRMTSGQLTCQSTQHAYLFSNSLLALLLVV